MRLTIERFNQILSITFGAWTNIFVFIVVLLSTLCSDVADGSLGDRSKFYVICHHNCVIANCSDVLVFRERQALPQRALRWSCDEECKYDCMWSTIAHYRLNRSQLVQFHGKWPFRRWLGMQEPASVIFSLLNLIAFHYMTVLLLRHTSVDAPLRRMWLGYSVLCTFTWLWSAVFHARDTPLTERMDYFCAFACVLYKMFAAVLRLSYPKHEKVRTMLLGPVLGFFAYHVWYLSSVKFDYGYNMTINIAAGMLSVTLWLAFCLHQAKVHGRAAQVWRCAFVVITANLLFSLEALDFAPFWSTFDAHSLWHAGTAVLPVFWARFLIDDMQYLHQQKQHIPSMKHQQDATASNGTAVVANGTTNLGKSTSNQNGEHLMVSNGEPAGQRRVSPRKNKGKRSFGEQNGRSAM